MHTAETKNSLLQMKVVVYGAFCNWLDSVNIYRLDVVAGHLWGCVFWVVSRGFQSIIIARFVLPVRAGVHGFFTGEKS